MTAATGLIIDGEVVPVDGLAITNARDDKAAVLAPGDCRPRPTRWVRQIVLHTTKGIWPQHVIPGAGPPGKHLAVGEFWRGDPKHSAAHLVVGRAGEVSCLADLQRVAAYHATAANDWSIGIETYQEGGGGIYEAALASTVKLVVALVRLFGIQFQIPGKAYRRAPLERLDEDGRTPGGQHVIGVVGHRDVTRRRGQGDPGDVVFLRLQAAGAEPLITDGGNDLTVWKGRQVALGFAPGDCDGIPGPKTTAALRERGFPGGVWALGTDEQRRAVFGTVAKPRRR